MTERTKRRNPVPLSERELWTKQDLADALGICKTKLQKLHSECALPKPIMLGASWHWRVREVRDWLAAGCPDRVRWSWTPSELMPLADAIRLRRLELKNLEASIERIQNG